MKNESAIQLLADLLKWPVEEILAALDVCDQYHVYKKRKNSGGLRTISVPNQVLKIFQQRLLKYFLYRLPTYDWGIIHGCRRGCSHITNAREHAKKDMRFLLRLDLADAFPSVKKDYLRPFLREILLQEIEGYQRNLKHPLPIFPTRRAAWFREILKAHPQRSLFAVLYDDPHGIIEDFVEIILSLTIFNDCLPQGAPTSPWFLNLAVSYSNILTEIRYLLDDDVVMIRNDFERGIILTVYVDDFSLSSVKPIQRETVEDIIGLIERKTPFRVNRKKTLYYRRDRIAPMVTGLRIVTMKKSQDALGTFLKENASLRTKREFKNALRHHLNEKGEWAIETVRLPKLQIRKIRGLIYQACLPENRERLALKVEGHIAHLKAVYGEDLPRQIAVPWKKYLSLK